MAFFFAGFLAWCLNKIENWNTTLFNINKVIKVFFQIFWLSKIVELNIDIFLSNSQNIIIYHNIHCL